MIHLLVIALLAVSTWAGFRCPPARSIVPCECFSHPYDRVQCDSVRNFTIVRLYIGGKFSQAIPLLRLTKMPIFSVPAHALENVSVRRLVLRDSNISLIEKDAFKGQAFIKLLVLANNMFEDIPTEALQYLYSLQSLSLEENFITRVPDRAFPQKLNALIYLTLSYNKISEIDKNAFPKNLKSLFIEWNHLSTFNGSLNGLKDLEAIFANDNEIINISGDFEGLPNLKSLYLDGNYISDISDAFLNLTSITHLSLSRNRIGDVGVSLSNLINLKYLDLSANDIKELHWTFFENVKHLQTLDLSDNILNTICPSMTLCTCMCNYGRRMEFPSTNGLNCFHNMKSLRILYLSNNRLKNIDAISQYPLPSLISLRLDHNQLSTLGKQMTFAWNLRELDISYNKFTSLNAYYLSHNEELARLGMEGNPWNCTKEIVSMLRGLAERGVAIQGRPDC